MNSPDAQSAAPVIPPRADLIAVSLFLLVGLAIRLFLAARSGLWRDEALFLFITQLPTIGEVVGFLHYHESHPPLFYLLMRAWQSVVGRSDAAVLALPALLGVLSIPVLYGIGRRMFDRRTGLIAAGLGAVLPMLCYYAAEVRPYCLMPLLALVAVYQQWALVTIGSVTERGLPWRHVILFSLVTAALLLLHNWSWLVFVSQIVAGLALVLFISRTRGEAMSTRAAVALAAGFAAAFVLAAVWIPGLIYQIAHAGHAGRVPPGIMETILVTLRATLAASADAISDSLLTLVGATFVAAVIAAWLQGTRGGAARSLDRTELQQQRAGILLIAIVVLLTMVQAAALSPRTDLLHDKCLVTLAPLLLLLLAAGIASAGRVRSIAPVVIAVAFGVLYVYADLRQGQQIKSNAREIAAEIHRKARPDDLIVVAPEWVASGLNRYYDGPQEQLCYPRFGRGTAVWWNDVRRRVSDPEAFARAKDRLTEARRARRRVWLVLAQEDASIRLELPPDDAAFPPELDTGKVTLVRTLQLARHLADLYGRPDSQAIPPDPREGRYKERVFLFTPPTDAGDALP